MKTKKIAYLIIIVTALLAVPLFSLPTEKAYADSFSCYEESRSGHVELECPSLTISSAIGGNSCYMEVAGGQGYGTANCNNMTLAQNTPPSSGPQSVADAATECQEQGGRWDDNKCITEEIVEVEADCKPPEGQELNESNCKMVLYLINGINFLSALVGIAAVFSLIWAGYQYIFSRDNPQVVSSAKNRIAMTVIALLLFAFMWAILQWLIPGGVL